MSEQAVAKIPPVVLSAALKDVAGIRLDLEATNLDLETSRALREVLADDVRRETFYINLDKRWQEWQGDAGGEYPKQPGPLLLLQEAHQFADGLDQVEPTGAPDALVVQSAATTARGNALIQLIGTLTVIPRNLACEVAAALSWLKIRDGCFIASKAPVLALTAPTLTKFQVPLAVYFREVLNLSVPVVDDWKESTLSIQLRRNGARFSVNSLPSGWSVAISFEQQPPIILDDKSRQHEVQYAESIEKEHRLAIVPFGSASEHKN